MRAWMLFSVLLAGCGGGELTAAQRRAVLPHVQRSAIVDGTLDTGDPSVIELFYIVSYPPSACDGSSACLATCFDASGQPCTSGARCVCGPADTCSSELIGPHTLLTAGHCTDLTAGGEVTGPGGPAVTLCTSTTDISEVLTGGFPSTCNGVIFAIFNNTCSTDDDAATCELDLIVGTDGGGSAAGGGNFIIVDQATNPGYQATVSSPGNDNDIGLVHLQDSTLANGGSEPAVLPFNRTSLGSSCSSLGSLKFVGYGTLSGSDQIAGVKYSVSHAAAVLDAYHVYEGDPSTTGVTTSCQAAGTGDPTCSGDSGGPELDSQGAIVSVTSEGDENCSSYGQDTRTDPHAAWIDEAMKGWGDPVNVPLPAKSGCGCTGTSPGSSLMAWLALVGWRRRRAGRAKRIGAIAQVTGI